MRSLRVCAETSALVPLRARLRGRERGGGGGCDVYPDLSEIPKITNFLPVKFLEFGTCAKPAARWWMSGRRGKRGDVDGTFATSRSIEEAKEG